MKRYRLNSIAKSDLTSIHKYIARDNLTAADRLILTSSKSSDCLLPNR